MALKFAVNNSLSEVTSLPTSISDNFGSMTLLQTQTASSSATIDFTSNIDSTYDSYVFKFIDIHPATNGVHFTFQSSTDSGSNYNTTLTTSAFWSYHDEADANTQLGYKADNDQAQGTSFQQLSHLIGNDNDQSLSGTLQLFNPSSTTYVKHFISNNNYYHQDDYSINFYTAGYFNTTSAINAVQFKMSSGNIDDGVIKLYGIS